MTDHEKYMQQALLEAQTALSKNEVPIGVVIVSNNRVIARGHNQTQTLNDVTAHAEMIAITSASDFMESKYLKDCTIYITLEPCVMCAGALAWSQIPNIVFGAYDKKKGYSTFCPEIFHSKINIIGGVLQDACSQILTDFFKNKRF